MGGWVDGWIHKLVNMVMGGWIDGWMRRMDECIIQCVHQSIDGQTKG